MLLCGMLCRVGRRFGEHSAAMFTTSSTPLFEDLLTKVGAVCIFHTLVVTVAVVWHCIQVDFSFYPYRSENLFLLVLCVCMYVIGL